MREFKTNPEIPILETHYPIKRTNGSKRWVLASTGSQFIQKRLYNENVESAYHQTIAVAKRHLKPGEIYYERNLKNDKSEGLFGMHSFVTSTFYWRLDCDLCYDYQITYAFHNCPFEDAIRRLMRAYPLDRCATAKDLQPDFTTFYETVLQIQDKQFLFTF